MSNHADLKPYMGYERSAGSWAGAVLVFSRDWKEARRLTWYNFRDFHDYAEWIDITCRKMEPCDHIMCLMESGEPHVIEHPPSCHWCGQWGDELTEDERGEISCPLCLEGKERWC